MKSYHETGLNLFRICAGFCFVLFLLFCCCDFDDSALTFCEHNIRVVVCVDCFFSFFCQLLTSVSTSEEVCSRELIWTPSVKKNRSVQVCFDLFPWTPAVISVSLVSSKCEEYIYHGGSWSGCCFLRGHRSRFADCLDCKDCPIELILRRTAQTE